MFCKRAAFWGPHAIMIAWGEEERSPRLSPAACGGARLSDFSDDECANRDSRKRIRKCPQTFPNPFSHVPLNLFAKAPPLQKDYKEFAPSDWSYLSTPAKNASASP